MQQDPFYSRTTLLLGDEAQDMLQRASVLVVGLGGVGGYAAEMLCRAGVGNLTIVDSDTVSHSNLNRQLIALNSTVGHSKVDLFCQRFRDINPSVNITPLNTFLRDDEMISLLEDNHFDYVVDAIDTLSPKVFLLYHSTRLHIPVVSAMGSGGKLDPALVQVTDIAKTYNCPLATMVRKHLHKLGLYTGFKAVFSPEKVSPSAMYEDPSQNHRTTIGTISYMPALFGCHCASVVIRDLIDNNAK